MVLALHGTGGTARLMAGITGFNALADREGFAVAYPQALGEQGTEDHTRAAAWNAGPGCGCPLYPEVDDVGFLRALLARLVAKGVADPRRCYVAGLSNGGRMAYRLTLEASDQIAAAGVVAGAWDGGGHAPLRPVPTLVLHGTEDAHIPYDGGRGTRGRDLEHLSVPHTVHRWALLMGCDGRARRRFEGPYQCDTLSGPGAEVALWTLPGAGHAWPGGRAWSPAADRPVRDFSASERLWAWFQRWKLETP